LSGEPVVPRVPDCPGDPGSPVVTGETVDPTALVHKVQPVQSNLSKCGPRVKGGDCFK